MMSSAIGFIRLSVVATPASPAQSRGDAGVATTWRRSASRDLRLQPQHVVLAHADVAQALLVEQLLAAGAVVELVAEQLPVRGVLRELHLLQQYGEDAVHGDVVGHLDVLTLVARRVPDVHGDHAHTTRAPR